ncbi:MAG: hypothetical protein HY646_15980, partial [Acidobacteria bacterium]|nr:hypothetical protein [Acidobacteriota bacterium]
RLVVERLRDSIVPDEKAGESRLVAILNRYRPLGSTASIDFPTTRPVRPTTKSHINAVVQHSGWEGRAAEILETHDAVKFYARNDHLNLVIPYVYLDVEHNYEPDFIVQLQNDVKLLLEIKGFEIHNPEQINSKHNAAKRWVMAVNNLRDEAVGRWDFLVSRDLTTLSADLNQATRPLAVAENG